MDRTVLTGKFEILNEPFLREKANRKSDPRCIFYEAILGCETYEAYFRHCPALAVYSKLIYRIEQIGCGNHQVR
jgi:hypothetical protein